MNRKNDRKNEIRAIRLIAACATALVASGCARQTICREDLDAHLRPVREYQYGANRAPLKELEAFALAHAGDPQALAQIESELGKLARSNARIEARAFACNLLGLVGSAGSVPGLAALLDEPAIAFHARQALQRIPDPAAGRALRAALERSQGEQRSALASSLAARGEMEAPQAPVAPVHRPVPQPKAGTSDVAALLRDISGADPARADDAAGALARLPGAGIDSEIVQAAQAAAPGARVRLIGVWAERGAMHGIANVREWAKSAPEEAVRTAAFAALGKAGTAAEMDWMPRFFAEANSTADARAAQDAAWALFRRTGDFERLSKAVDSAMAVASPERQEVLRKLLARAKETVRAPGPTAETLEIEPLPTGEGDPILPDGHRLAAYHDCGTDELSGGGGGPAIRATQGKPFKFGGRDPVRSALFDPKQVRFEITGLRDGAAYVLGLTWWDADGKGRVQSVHLGSGEPVAWTKMLPAARPLAFHKDAPTWARVHLPVPSAQVRNGALHVAVNCEEGPNAVVSELWLLERADNIDRKRVLIVTCDDWKGHLWRLTGPELASILREDPRFEVTITESPWILASPAMDHYDAVVIHFKNYAERLPLGPEVQAGLEKFATSGRGVILAHFGCGAFEEWPGFAGVAGRVWDKTKRGHDPYGPFRVLVRDPAHAITRGMSDFDTTDELYTCLKGEAAIRVLCAAISKIDKREHPMAFVGASENTRVFHCTLGHDVAAFRNDAARKLYRRGVAWACGMQTDR